MKKFTVSILVLAMVLSGALMQAAATETASVQWLTGWNVTYVEPTILQRNAGYTPTDWSLARAGVSSSEAYSGNNSMQIKFPRSYQDYTSIDITSTVNTSILTGTETQTGCSFSFKLKGTYTINDIQIGVQGNYLSNNKGSADAWNGSSFWPLSTQKWNANLEPDGYRFIETDLGNGWKQYDLNNVIVKQATPKFEIIVLGNSNFYIDDITLTRDDNTTGYNYISNSGFETVTTQTASLTTPIANSYDKSLRLTWKFYPSVGAAGGFVIKNHDTGEILTSSVTACTSATQVQQTGNTIYNFSWLYKYMVTSLVNGRCYSYDIIKNTGGDILTATVSNYPTSALRTGRYFNHGYYLDQWCTYNLDNSTTGFFADVDCKPDFNVKYDGNSSMKINSNTFAEKDSTYYRLIQYATLENNTNYTLSFKVKTNGVRAAYIYTEPKNGTRVLASSALISYNTDVTTDWVTKTYNFNSAATATNGIWSFYLEWRGYGEMWLDNLSVCKNNGDGTYGVNLIKNGGFEYEVGSVAINNNVISWENPVGAQWDRVNIYKMVDGTETYCGYATLSENSFVLDEAPAADDVYILKTAVSDYESLGVTSVYTPISEVTGITFNGNTITWASSTNASVNIYKQNKDLSLTKLNTVPATASFTLADAPTINDIYVFKSIANGGSESAGVVVKSYEVSVPVFTQTDLTTGTVDATTSVKNNFAGNDFGAMLCICIYKVQNNVQELVCQNYVENLNISQMSIATTLNTSLSFTKTAGTEYIAKAFVWKNGYTAYPLCDVSVLQ